MNLLEIESRILHLHFCSLIQLSEVSNSILLGHFAVATPKQIRELMQVDGLTNDEVKSHLQVSLPFHLFIMLRLYRHG